ncbi:hypothetical protein PVAND_003606 [Polypedilum vanderplanki]|uniref:Neugrin n=1 Tax=Polypedilum vanderplanki TaxID=319348 RepID=A0A9J6BV29_POLVA|nr:hypothetical protein PVAND_003606 [Polypedilum vanderplanki]
MLCVSSRALNKISIINSCCRLIVIRNYVPRNRETKLPENPGLDKRLKHFKDDILKFEDDPEMIDSMEPDFMNLNMTHREHEKQISKMKDKNYQLIIGRKYFKSKCPNFLTFSEKEQIRDLHSRDPYEWTIDKLSESFPADPLTISLILRAKWQPKDLKRIEKHDQSVLKNWNEFKKGNLEVEPVLAEHLKKFAFRDFNALTEPKPNRKFGVEVPKPKKNEFLSIITSCKKTKSDDKLLENISSQETRITEERPHVDADTFVLNGRDSSDKNITLQEFQKMNPKFNLDNNESNNTDLMKIDEIPELKISKMTKEDNELIIYNKDVDHAIEALEIQAKIRIPKKLYKKGKIYKVDDCFYADDGDFLYRVPGFFKQ